MGGPEDVGGRAGGEEEEVPGRRLVGSPLVSMDPAGSRGGFGVGSGDSIEGEADGIEDMAGGEPAALGGGREAFADAAAVRAEVAWGAAFQVELVDALVASGSAALDAAVGGGDVGVFEAGGNSSGQFDRCGDFRGGDVGDRDFDGGRGEAEFEGSKSDLLAVFEFGFGDGLVVDERAVGRAEVADADLEVAHEDLAMNAGDSGVGEQDVAVRGASNAVRTGFEFELVLAVDGSGGEQPGHER